MEIREAIGEKFSQEALIEPSPEIFTINPVQDELFTTMFIDAVPSDTGFVTP